MVNCNFMSPGLNADIVGGIKTACCLMSQIISVSQIFSTSSCYICLRICLYVYFDN